EPVGAGGLAVHAHLHAQHQVRVGAPEALEKVHVQVGEIVELVGVVDQADGGDVHESEDAGLARADDELAEAGQGVGAAGAPVHPGRDAAAAGERVGADAPEGHAPIDVGVQVDQAGDDVVAGGVDHPVGRFGRDVGLDRGDAVAL